MLDISCIHGSSTRLEIIVVSIIEGHKEKMDSRGLDKHLILRLLMDCGIKENNF